MMAGHSRWAQVKHKKAGTDAERGALFSKLSRLVSAAAREGGSDPDTNPKLRQAIEHARAAGMPKDNIERATVRAAGADGSAIRAVEYEIIGPSGSALLATGLTDNPNRTTAQVKRLVSEHGAALTEQGGVGWMFERRWVFEFPARGSPEDLGLLLIGAGAEDIAIATGGVQAAVGPERASALQKALAGQGLVPTRSFLSVIPRSPIDLPPAEVGRIAALVRGLDAHPDITGVWTNVAGLE